MNKAALVSRYLMGLIFVVFGLNGFFMFIPMPKEMPEQAMKFFSGLTAAPYFMPLLKGTEVICGLALLSGLYVPLALVVLAPIILQIFLYHTIVDPSGAAMAIALVVMLVICAIDRKQIYAPLLKAK